MGQDFLYMNIIMLLFSWQLLQCVCNESFSNSNTSTQLCLSPSPTHPFVFLCVRLLAYRATIEGECNLSHFDMGVTLGTGELLHLRVCFWIFWVDVDEVGNGTMRQSLCFFSLLPSYTVNDNSPAHTPPHTSTTPLEFPAHMCTQRVSTQPG